MSPKKEEKKKLQLQRDLKYYAPTWKLALMPPQRSNVRLTRYPLKCPLCRCPYLVKYGIHARSGEQKFKCKFCDYVFSASSLRPFRRFEHAEKTLKKLKDIRHEQEERKKKIRYF